MKFYITANNIGINKNKNQYYDIHFLLNSLTDGKLIPDYITKIPQPIIEFIDRIIPSQYKSENVSQRSGRLIKDIEYTTPYKILMEDKLYSKFRTKI